MTRAAAAVSAVVACSAALLVLANRDLDARGGAGRCGGKAPGGTIATGEACRAAGPSASSRGGSPRVSLAELHRDILDFFGWKKKKQQRTSSSSIGTVEIMDHDGAVEVRPRPPYTVLPGGPIVPYQDVRKSMSHSGVELELVKDVDCELNPAECSMSWSHCRPFRGAAKLARHRMKDLQELVLPCKNAVRRNLEYIERFENAYLQEKEAENEEKTPKVCVPDYGKVWQGIEEKACKGCAYCRTTDFVLDVLRMPISIWRTIHRGQPSYLDNMIRRTMDAGITCEGDACNTGWEALVALVDEFREKRMPFSMQRAVTASLGMLAEKPLREFQRSGQCRGCFSATARCRILILLQEEASRWSDDRGLSSLLSTPACTCWELMKTVDKDEYCKMCFHMGIVCYVLCVSECQ